MTRTVGIDLGTTYSLIAYQDKREGRPKCIPGPYGTPLCPSVVSVDADGLDHRWRIRTAPIADAAAAHDLFVSGLMGARPRPMCRTS